MSVTLRASGDPEEIEIMVKLLAVVFDLTGSGHIFPNQGAPGVRVYLKAGITWAGDPE